MDIIDFRETKFRNLSIVSKTTLIRRGFSAEEHEYDEAYPIDKINYFYDGIMSDPVEVQYILGIPFYKTCLNSDFPTKKQVSDILTGPWMYLEDWPLPVLTDNILNDISYQEPVKCSFVYVIKTPYSEFGYKVGKSDNPVNRGQAIGLTLPFETELIKTFIIDSGREALAIEAAIHEYFKYKKIRGEWFNLNDNDLQEMSEIISLRKFRKGNPRKKNNLTVNLNYCFYKEL